MDDNRRDYMPFDRTVSVEHGSIPPHVLPPGTILIDRYRIGEVLGQGGDLGLPMLPET